MPLVRARVASEVGTAAVAVLPAAAPDDAPLKGGGERSRSIVARGEGVEKCAGQLAFQTSPIAAPIIGSQRGLSIGRNPGPETGVYLEPQHDAERFTLAPRLLFDINGVPKMLWTIALILIVLWLLGFAFHIGGGLIHIILVVALIVGLIQLFSGRRVV